MNDLIIEAVNQYHNAEISVEIDGIHDDVGNRMCSSISGEVAAYFVSDGVVWF
ncbi:hypothetical protein [Neisseria yangbaofengii]|uniref:hypothetical protein n=1 Tax=Neisseria yangbaofengii TaxID=2709396 RepID=UPI003B9DEE52